MDILRFCINTLNEIRVSGKEDLSRMLGVIGTLEALIKEAEKQQKEENTDGR